jgi:hypothetical protein
MNTKTFFSKFISFSEKWTKYKKWIAPLPLGWIVMSDYCLDDKNKNDCITFTICPMMPNDELSLVLEKKLPKDIKDMAKVSDDVIKFLRDAYPFFTISILIREKKKIGNIDDFKIDIKNFKESPYLNSKQQKQFNKFDNYLKKKNINHKVLENMRLIIFMFTRIVEFLAVKHYTEEIHWFPDRDAVMDVSDRIILDLINTQCTNLLYGRRIPPKLIVGLEDKEKGIFVFDPLVRYPDIITGVVSSIDFEHGGTEKEKHFDLLVNAILENPRITCTSVAVLPM